MTKTNTTSDPQTLPKKKKRGIKKSTAETLVLWDQKPFLTAKENILLAEFIATQPSLSHLDVSNLSLYELLQVYHRKYSGSRKGIVTRIKNLSLRVKKLDQHEIEKKLNSLDNRVPCTGWNFSECMTFLIFFTKLHHVSLRKTYQEMIPRMRPLFSPQQVLSETTLKHQYYHMKLLQKNLSLTPEEILEWCIVAQQLELKPVSQQSAWTVLSQNEALIKEKIHAIGAEALQQLVVAEKKKIEPIENKTLLFLDSIEKEYIPENTFVEKIVSKPEAIEMEDDASVQFLEAPPIGEISIEKEPVAIDYQTAFPQPDFSQMNMEGIGAIESNGIYPTRQKVTFTFEVETSLYVSKDGQPLIPQLIVSCNGFMSFPLTQLNFQHHSDLHPTTPSQSNPFTLTSTGLNFFAKVPATGLGNVNQPFIDLTKS